MSRTPAYRSDRGARSLSVTVVGNPVVQTLAAMLVVSLLTWTSSLIGLVGMFVLAPPVLFPPWALVTSVYAHASLTHLLSNAIVVAVAGSFVAWSTTRLRFHAFFVTTGTLAGVAQVWAGELLGMPTAVLGASGAALALVGYLITANPASVALFDSLRLSPRIVALVAAVIAIGLTVTFSAPGSALVAHFTGATLGLLAGRTQLLTPDRR